MKKLNAITISLNGVSYIATLSQTLELFNLIQLIISIICSVVILGTNVYIWFKKAKADGKITIEELEEGKNIIEEGKTQIENVIKDGVKNENISRNDKQSKDKIE